MIGRRIWPRNRLTTNQSVLKGLYSGRPVEDCLRGHGRLTEAEVSQMTSRLKWQLETREP